MAIETEFYNSVLENRKIVLTLTRVVPYIRLAEYPDFFISGIRPDIRFHFPDIWLAGYPVKLSMRTSNEQTFFRTFSLSMK